MFSQLLRWGSQAGRAKRSRSAIGPIEQLEERTLLSTWQPHREDDYAARAAERRFEPRIVQGEPTVAFPSVAMVGDRSSSNCSGTLIAPQFVLTAGHCAEGIGPTNGRVTIGGSTYSTTRVIVHPSYNGRRLGNDSANDIAIMQLSSSVAGITPSTIYRSTPTVGQTVHLVGYGAGGTGSTGHNGDFGTKRSGTNTIDRVTPKLLFWEFDDLRESNTAPGDSGGPAFIEVAGIYYVAGVTSGGDRSDAGYGDTSFDTRVDAYASWIDAIIGTASPSPSPDPVPEPAEGDDHVNEPGAGATSISITGGMGQASGTLEAAGDRDAFRIQLASAASVEVEMTTDDPLLDTYLRVFDASGNLLTENDDAGSAMLSRVQLSLSAGAYYISAGSYADRDSGNYNLQIQTVAGDDHADDMSGATAIGAAYIGTTMTGRIDRSGDVDFFSFVATRSGRVDIHMLSNDGRLDPMLAVFTQHGVMVASNDDWGRSLNSHVKVKARAGQTYFIQAHGFGDSTSTYQLLIGASWRASKGIKVIGGKEHPGGGMIKLGRDNDSAESRRTEHSELSRRAAAADVVLKSVSRLRRGAH